MEHWLTVSPCTYKSYIYCYLYISSNFGFVHVFISPARESYSKISCGLSNIWDEVLVIYIWCFKFRAVYIIGGLNWKMCSNPLVFITYVSKFYILYTKYKFQWLVFFSKWYFCLCESVKELEFLSRNEFISCMHILLKNEKSYFFMTEFYSSDTY